MEWCTRKSGCLLFLHCSIIIGILALAPKAGASFLGVVYGASGDNLPTPDQTVELLQLNGVTHVRIYDTNPTILKAFANTSIEMLVGVTNEELASIGVSNVSAANWVKSNIIPYVPYTNITGIAVGSEVLSSGNLSTILVPAMRYIHAALIAADLDAMIKVTTPHSISTLLEISFPPSQGSFNSTFLPVILPMLNFLSLTGSYLMLNVYPYYSYQENAQVIALTYATFAPNQGVADNYSNLQYYSLYDALLDAAYAGMKELNFSSVPIIIGETGWPTAGDSQEVGASLANAAAYNGNLAKRMLNKTGTPAKPSVTPSVYLYELYNENLRTGPTSERNWGIFAANNTPLYPIDLSGTGRSDVGNITTLTWCVTKQGVNGDNLQHALDYACGQGGANCSAIQSGGVCWIPDTVQSHASYAFNAYYQKMGQDPATCSFKGLASVTNIDPSYGSCIYLQNSTTIAEGSSPNAGVQAAYRHSATNAICLTVLLIVTMRHFFQ